MKGPTIVRSPAVLKELTDEWGRQGVTTGFVPTMGALHHGHASLIDRSVKENPITIASIFVNPTQFNDPSDLIKYPRTPEEDLLLLEKHNCSCVFMPSVEDMYGDKMELLDLDLGPMATVMEGRFRKGHFQGMVTIVYKLLKLVRPAHAYFGEKDFQQLAIIRYMVSRMALPVQVIGCETIRESDGLAMSSRNIHLTERERAEAPVIYSAMKKYASVTGSLTVQEVCSGVVKEIEKTGLFRVEYFQIVESGTLKEITAWTTSSELRACIAVRTSRTRLIDNIPVTFAYVPK